MKSIYVFESHGQFKIGVSQNVDARLRSIMVGNPSVQAIYESEQVENAYKVENMIHNHFVVYHTSGEWFSIPPQVNIIETVKWFVEKYGARKENPKTGEDKLKRMLERIFAPIKKTIVEMEEENEKINMENEKLKRKLQSRGWSDSDIQKIVDEAERSVLLHYNT